MVYQGLHPYTLFVIQPIFKQNLNNGNLCYYVASTVFVLCAVFVTILRITVQRPGMAFVKLIQLPSCFFLQIECVTHTVNEQGAIILKISQRP